MVQAADNNLSFTSKTENLTLVESLVDSICEQFKINEDHYGNILVAVTEAVTNAIQHGNKYNPDKSIDVSFAQHAKGLSFIVKDQGEGFDFTNLPDPTDPENIEKPHGRGIFLMRHLADKVEFEDNGRIVALNFNVAS
ncbi:MAG: ATP-binding protein [Flavobacteriales bacterium]|nr:MAG: ATP-binding protein [Flavobacteriales bacterium]